MPGVGRDTAGSWGSLGQAWPHRALQEISRFPSHRECSASHREYSIPQGVLYPTRNAPSHRECSASHRESCCCLLIRAHFGCPHLAVPTLLSPSSAALPQEIPEMLLHPGAGAVTQGMQLHILASPGQVFPEDFVSHMGMNHTGDSHADPRAWDNQSHLFKGRFPAQPSGKEFD